MSLSTSRDPKWDTLGCLGYCKIGVFSINCMYLEQRKAPGVQITEMAGLQYPKSITTFSQSKDHCVPNSEGFANY